MKNKDEKIIDQE